MDEWSESGEWNEWDECNTFYSNDNTHHTQSKPSIPLQLKGWVHRALACLRDWAEQRSADQLNVIVWCRAGKRRSRACALVLQHCLEKFGATVTLQHLSGNQCWQNGRGMLCRYCSHLGNDDRNEVLNRTFAVIGMVTTDNDSLTVKPKSEAMPKKSPADIAMVTTDNESLAWKPKSKAMPKKRPADIAMVTTDNESLAGSACDKPTSGRLEPVHCSPGKPPPSSVLKAEARELDE